MATPEEQTPPTGLLVVTVIVTIFPPSVAPGVYVNKNGETVAEAGVTVPDPLSVIVTAVADPPKVLPVTVIAAVLHVEPVRLLSVTVGGFTQPHDTAKRLPVVVHPARFRTEK